MKTSKAPKRVLEAEFLEADGTDVGAGLIAAVFGFLAVIVTACEEPLVAQVFFWAVTAVLLVIAISARLVVRAWRNQERERFALEEAETIISKDRKDPAS